MSVQPVSLSRTALPSGASVASVVKNQAVPGHSAGANDIFVRFAGGAKPTAPSSPQQTVARVGQAIQGLPGSQPVIGLLDQWVNGIRWRPLDYHGVVYHMEYALGGETAKKLRNEFFKTGEANTLFGQEAQFSEALLRYAVSQTPPGDKRDRLEHPLKIREASDYQLEPGCRDEVLLGYVCDYLLDGMVTCHEVSKATLRKALDSGLQDLIDAALLRQVKVTADDDGDESEEPAFSVYDIGTKGSAKLIPYLESHFERNNPELNEKILIALQRMEDSINAPTASAARRTYKTNADILEQRLLHKLDQNPHSVPYLRMLAELGRASAVPRLMEAWQSADTLDEKNRDDSRRETLNSWMNAIATGTPGAVEALESIRAEVAQFLQQAIARKPESSFLNNSHPHEELLIQQAALLGAGLADLPGRTPPEGWDSKNSLDTWALEGDFNYLVQSLRMVEVMEKRGIPDAGDKFAALQTELEVFLRENLSQLLDGIPEGSLSYFYNGNHALRDFMQVAGRRGRPTLIPFLQRLLDEPWHPSIQWSNWSNGNPQFSDDKTVLAKDGAIQFIEEAIDTIRMRHS